MRFGIDIVTDERAPPADESFGYFGDMHTDRDSSYYLDLLLGF